MDGWCTAMIRRISSASGKSMKWKTQRRRNASGSSFSLFDVMMTTGRSFAATSSPVSPMTKRIRSSSWRRSFGNSRSALSTSSMRENDTLVGAERATERPELDVMANVLHVALAEPRVVEALDRVVDVEAVLRARRRLHRPVNELRSERLGNRLGEKSLAGSGLTANQERSLESQGGIHGGLDRVVREVGRGTLETEKFAHSGSIEEASALRKRPSSRALVRSHGKNVRRRSRARSSLVAASRMAA